MCTVTFLPHGSGYYLGMNRDEKLARVPGLPPRTFVENGCRVTCPSEPGGGTWISLNEHGGTLALINWYSIPGEVRGKARSRGEAVQSLRTVGDVDQANRRLGELSLAQMKPFRLIGIFPDPRLVVEWRWDLKRLQRVTLDWTAQQWISSGFDEPMAQRIRGETFEGACGQASAGTLGWLRRLHGSHAPEPGPFSTCMHRSDAATVSYCEVVVAEGLGRMEYFEGPLCKHSTDQHPTFREVSGKVQHSTSNTQGNSKLQTAARPVSSARPIPKGLNRSPDPAGNKV